MPSFHLNGGLTIAGHRVAYALVQPILERMRAGFFTNADLVEVATARLRDAGKPVAMAFDLADRVRRDKARGRCEVVAKDHRGRATYRWFES